jgi:hypothetical protein
MRQGGSDSFTAMGDRLRPAAKDVIEERKARHAGIVKLASGMSAWITSVPGDKVITFDYLEGSPFPEEMRQCGFILEDEGDGQRILASALVEHFVRAADGQLELLTEGSTRLIAESRHHAGICRIRKWSFEL